MSVRAAEAGLDAATRGDLDAVRALTSGSARALPAGDLDAAVVAASAGGHHCS